MKCFVWFKACERCGGDLSLESDWDGQYIKCLQCGAVRYDLPDMVSQSNPVLAVETQEIEPVSAYS